MNNMNIRNVLHSGDVVRFHNHVGIDKQKTSDHQWGVALIVQHIYPDCSKGLLMAALTHDAAEYLTGDIPFPTKQANPELGSILREIERNWEEKNGVDFDLSQLEHSVLKMADTLEGMWYCVHQVRLGHINAKRPFRKWRMFFTSTFSNQQDEFPRAFDLLNEIITEMGEL